jgi:hypothetical protein
LVLGLLAQGAVKCHAQGQKDQSNAATKKQQTLTALPVKPQTRLIYTYSCAKPADENQENLCIEREAAKAAVQQAAWARWTFILGLIGTGIVLATIFYTRRSVGAAISAANAAERAADIARSQYRPIVLLSINQSEIDYAQRADKTLFPTVSYTLRNVGKSPAHIIAVDVIMDMAEEAPMLRYLGQSALFDPVIDDGCKSGAFPAQLPVAVSSTVKSDIMLSSQSIFIYGYVFYEDVMFTQMFTRYFMLRYEPSVDRFVLHGGADYNYERHNQAPKTNAPFPQASSSHPPNS